MDLYKLSEKDIRDYVKDSRIYHRGRMYFFNSFVEDVNILEAEGSVTARVHGSKEYIVKLYLNAKREVEDGTCTCPFYKEWRRPCKHIAAVLFEARRMIGSKYTRYRNSYKAVSAVFAKLEETKHSNYQGSRVQNHLHPTLYLTKTDERVFASLELGVGTTRSYVVRNAEEFIDAWVNGKKLFFGRHFTLDSKRQFFTGRDEQIMAILEDIYTAHTELSKQEGIYRFSGLIRGRQFQLMPSYLERFLDIMTGEAITASVFSRDLEIVPVTHEPIPVVYEIRQLDEWLSVRMDAKELPTELLPGGQYYYAQGKIYRVPQSQRKALSVIQQGFIVAGQNEMIVPPQYQNRFVSEVVPLMRNTGDVMVSPSLKERIVQASIQPVVYLDQYKKGISARVVFNYGQYQVNPASKEDLFTPSDMFILRDLDKEQPILDYFNQSGFFIEKEQFCLLDLGDVYQFVFEKLPELQSLAEVYYSEDFKKVTVRKRVNLSGRVSLVDNLLEISFDTSELDWEELKGILESFRKKKKFFRLKDGSILPLEESSSLSQLAVFSDHMDLNPKDFVDGTIRLPKYRALYMDSLLQESQFQILEKTRDLDQFVESLSSQKTHSYAIPESLQNVLRDYQKAGYQWLKGLSNNGLGGILADDMGLGKTLQVLALVLSEKEKRKMPALVVAPTSLVYNWVLEAKKFTPQLKVMAISGSLAERQVLCEKINQYDIVVTSYPLIRRDIEAYQNHRFSFCFIDEAQHVKNHFTQSARAIRKISANNRFALTGTPMENSLLELWAIFDFIMPSYLFTQQKFQERFVKPIMGDGSKKASQDLSRLIQPFILRRMKKDVLKELPEKIETTLTCELTDAQKDIYLGILAQVKQEIDLNIEQNGFERSQIQILAALTRLRQVCCHPHSFLEDYDGGSGKMNLLEEILEEALASGHRILLFSQFTSMLDIIGEELKKKDIDCFYLSGRTPPSERSDIVARFNEGEGQVFLLSLKAGGTGLTLTGADMVIHYDPWWNPAVEEQATDRAYRIGQDKVVQVFKLITRNTIEEKIQLLQEKKREMIDMVIQPGETMLHKLTKEEIRQLFEL
ncbi:MAG: DEAD/DEAH box helicase family protein [Clostridiaceae bacterium]|jgi:SNF2 family DNA or RNA helicase|nr:DEAD/DEAH box helicase family protein [Clostridiaceae bacterium]